MKKKVLIIVLVLVVLLIGLLIYLLNNKSSKTIELTYKTNGGVPYSGVPYKWEYEIADKSIVKFVKEYEIENDNKDGRVGAPILTNYVFKGLKEGTTTITFKYINITDGTVEKIEVNNIKVDSNKKISLVVD